MFVFCRLANILEGKGVFLTLCLCSRGHLWQVDPAPQELKVHLQVFPELFVSEAIDDWAEAARQDADDQEVCKSDLQDLTGEDQQEDDLHVGGNVGEHAHEELRSVEQDGLPGSLGGRLLRGERARRKQDLQVGEDQS